MISSCKGNFRVTPFYFGCIFLPKLCASPKETDKTSPNILTEFGELSFLIDEVTPRSQRSLKPLCWPQKRFGAEKPQTSTKSVVNEIAVHPLLQASFKAIIKK